MEVIGRMSGRFSHEFNNQLGIISNSAYLIGRKAQDPVLTLPAQAILRSVEVASAMTQRMQRLETRQRSGAQPLELGAWLEPLRPALAMVLGKRISLELRSADSPVYVQIAHDELELAIISMLLCAREMLPQGGAAVVEVRRIQAEQGELAAGDYAQLSIEALADGEERPAEPSPAAVDACEAWGLGLARSLGRSAGGGLWAAADPGHSFCARLALPEMLVR